MLSKTTLFILVFLLILTIRPGFSQTVYPDSISTIAFGSCNLADRPLSYFKNVLKNKPNLWIWLGDITYANSEDGNIIREKYAKVKANLNYKTILRSCKVIGVYDDHDFGVNNSGKDNLGKKESQQALLDFLDEPIESPRRKQEGIYWSYTFGTTGKQVKIILLDTRYFRDMPCDTGDILGEKQWKWLEKELASSTANITVIGSSIQFISAEHQYEKWAAFPKAKKRLTTLIQQHASKKIFFISGDRHFAEISKEEDLNLGYPLIEFTSSGLTHTRPYFPIEHNKYRYGKLFMKRNFGILSFDWKNQSMLIQIKKHNNKTLQETKLSLINFQEKKL